MAEPTMADPANAVDAAALLVEAVDAGTAVEAMRIVFSATAGWRRKQLAAAAGVYHTPEGSPPGQGREEPEQKKRTQAKNQNKKDRTRGSVFCLWRSAQRQTADGRRATHGGQTPTTHQKAVGALGNWTHLTGCIITSHTPYQQQKRPEIRSHPSFPPFSAP